jgi:hypothetical protein
MKPVIFIKLSDDGKQIIESSIRHPTDGGEWATYIHAAASDKIGEANERLVDDLKSARAANERLMAESQVHRDDNYLLQSKIDEMLLEKSK